MCSESAHMLKNHPPKVQVLFAQLLPCLPPVLSSVERGGVRSVGTSEHGPQVSRDPGILKFPSGQPRDPGSRLTRSYNVKSVIRFLSPAVWGFIGLSMKSLGKPGISSKERTHWVQL